MKDSYPKKGAHGGQSSDDDISVDGDWLVGKQVGRRWESTCE